MPVADLDWPFLAGAGFASVSGLGLAGLGLASGLSEDSSAQYCSSESLSHSMLGHSSSSSRLPRWGRDRPLGGFCALACLRRESGRSRSGSAFGDADRPRARVAGWSPDGKSAAGSGPDRNPPEG
ncbi:MAG TPA: hypothetical protein DHU96_08295 [Actinobacteria bacterium]|nr:hypothetical protein [Actinomycetota bacterium]